MKFFQRWVMPVLCCLIYLGVGLCVGYSEGRKATARAGGGLPACCSCCNQCQCDDCKCGAKFRPCCGACTCVAAREAGVARKGGGK